MAQFLIINGRTECPACGTELTCDSEQDRRIALMTHPATAACSLSGQFRVDRRSGNAERVEVPVES